MDPYLIPGTATLRNRRGITDALELEQLEADVSTLRIRQLLDGSVHLPGQWDLPHLQRVHRHVFGDLYEWAGEIRTIALRKADQAHPLPTAEHADDIFGRLARDDQLSGLDRAAFVSKVSQLQSDLFTLHSLPRWQHPGHHDVRCPRGSSRRVECRVAQCERRRRPSPPPLCVRGSTKRERPQAGADVRVDRVAGGAAGRGRSTAHCAAATARANRPVGGRSTRAA